MKAYYIHCDTPAYTPALSAQYHNALNPPTQNSSSSVFQKNCQIKYHPSQVDDTHTVAESNETN
jgi:hypothetical protein